MSIPSQTLLDRIKELLLYEPNTGLLRWKISRPGAAALTVAGTKRKERYIYVKVERCLFPAQNIAWFMMTGEWPKCLVDHHDGDTYNNVWKNLRQATHSQNSKNKPSKGYYWNKRRKAWHVQLRVEGCRLHLGYFNTEEQAALGYKAASEKHFGEFCYHKRPGAEDLT